MALRSHPIRMGLHKITGLQDPTDDMDAVNLRTARTLSPITYVEAETIVEVSIPTDYASLQDAHDAMLSWQFGPNAAAWIIIEQAAGTQTKLVIDDTTKYIHQTNGTTDVAYIGLFIDHPQGDRIGIKSENGPTDYTFVSLVSITSAGAGDHTAVVEVTDASSISTGDYIRLTPEGRKYFLSQSTFGSPTLLMPSTTGINVGDLIEGYYIPAGTKVLAVTPGVSVTMDADATGTIASATMATYTWDENNNYMRLYGLFQVTGKSGNQISLSVRDLVADISTGTLSYTIESCTVSRPGAVVSLEINDSYPDGVTNSTDDVLDVFGVWVATRFGSQFGPAWRDVALVNEGVTARVNGIKVCPGAIMYTGTMGGAGGLMVANMTRRGVWVFDNAYFESDGIYVTGCESGVHSIQSGTAQVTRAKVSGCVYGLSIADGGTLLASSSITAGCTDGYYAASPGTLVCADARSWGHVSTSYSAGSSGNIYAHNAIAMHTPSLFYCTHGGFIDAESSYADYGSYGTITHYNSQNTGGEIFAKNFRWGTNNSINSVPTLNKLGPNGSLVYDGSNTGAYYEQYTASLTHDFASIAAYSQATTTVTVTGATTSDAAKVTCLSGDVNGIVFTASVTAADTVTITAKNHTNAAVDPPSKTFQVFVTKVI